MVTSNFYSKKKQDFNLGSDSGKDADRDVFYEEQESKKRLKREKKFEKKDKQDKHTPLANKKAQGKGKKPKNIDWKKGYEDGLFDKDELYDEYMR